MGGWRLLCCHRHGAGMGKQSGAQYLPSSDRQLIASPRDRNGKGHAAAGACHAPFRPDFRPSPACLLRKLPQLSQRGPDRSPSSPQHQQFAAAAALPPFGWRRLRSSPSPPAFHVPLVRNCPSAPDCATCRDTPHNEPSLSPRGLQPQPCVLTAAAAAADDDGGASGHPAVRGQAAAGGPAEAHCRVPQEAQGGC